MRRHRGTKGIPCSRSLGEQYADRTGARRRVDHAHVQRLDLLSDDSLDSFRRRFPVQAEAALDAYDELDQRLAELAQRIAILRAELNGAGAGCPILTTVVCLDCGAFEVVTALRPWPLDRAMARTGIPERDLVTALELLSVSHAAVRSKPPDLDALTDPELHALVSLARIEGGVAESPAALDVARLEARRTGES